MSLSCRNLNLSLIAIQRKQCMNKVRFSYDSPLIPKKTIATSRAGKLLNNSTNASARHSKRRPSKPQNHKHNGDRASTSNKEATATSRPRHDNHRHPTSEETLPHRRRPPFNTEERRTSLQERAPSTPILSLYPIRQYQQSKS